jgi:hypothetical protein
MNIKYAFYGLLIVLFIGCNTKELTLLKKQNSELIKRIEILETQIGHLNYKNSVYEDKIILLIRQDAEILNIIGLHLKHNHGF